MISSELEPHIASVIPPFTPTAPHALGYITKERGTLHESGAVKQFSFLSVRPGVTIFL